jgi:Rieske 2Fe-2S family protein
MGNGQAMKLDGVVDVSSHGGQHQDHGEVLHETLPTHYYHDPDHYHRELEALWYTNWLCVASVDEVPEARSFKVVEVGDQSVILTRDQEGRLQAFYNTCRHRGSVLCEQASGTFLSDQIICPYHAWCYGLDGSLERTPFEMPYDAFDADKYALYRVGISEWAGHIFINLDEDNADSFADAMARPMARLHNWHLDQTRVGHRLVRDVQCNWKVFWENATECYHCPGIHPELCRVVPYAGKTRLAPEEGEPRLAEGAVTWSFDGQTTLPWFPDLTDDEQKAGHSYGMVMPNFVVVGHVDYARIIHMMPLGPETTRLTVHWLFREETMAHADFNVDKVTEFAALVVEQDAAACELNQKGLHCRRHEAGVVMPQEVSLNRLYQWIHDGLDAAGDGHT